MTEQRPFTAASFNQYLNEEKLMASYCPASDATYIPPRAICPRTHSAEMEWRELSGRGTLAAFTAVYIGITPMVQAGYDRKNPYCTAIVELEEGGKISAFLTGVDAKQPETIEIGMPLVVHFVPVGEGDDQHMMLAFKPAE